MWGCGEFQYPDILSIRPVVKSVIANSWAETSRCNFSINIHERNSCLFDLYGGGVRLLINAGHGRELFTPYAVFASQIKCVIFKEKQELKKRLLVILLFYIFQFYMQYASTNNIFFVSGNDFTIPQKTYSSLLIHRILSTKSKQYCNNTGHPYWFLFSSYNLRSI